MTLREFLGGDVQRVHDGVDALLNRDDGLLVLFDGRRMVSYIRGFGASPCQLELLSVELERAVRRVVAGQPTSRRKDRRNRETCSQDDGGGRGAGHRSVVDRKRQTVQCGDDTNRDRGRAAGPVFRLARAIA
jgi:hypothetical protein